MENSQELIGILQAISIVAKSLAVKLMKIDRGGASGAGVLRRA